MLIFDIREIPVMNQKCILEAEFNRENLESVLKDVKKEERKKGK